MLHSFSLHITSLDRPLLQIVMEAFSFCVCPGWLLSPLVISIPHRVSLFYYYYYYYFCSFAQKKKIEMKLNSFVFTGSNHGLPD